MTQEVAVRIYRDLTGWTHVFFDGSMLQDGSASATCIASQLGTDRLVKEERGPLLAQRAARSLLVHQEQGCDFVVQWLPSYVGIAENEATDKLAKRTYFADTPLTDEMLSPGAYVRAQVAARRPLFLCQRLLSPAASKGSS
ncbi:hypothetical protein MRX96_023478 [Rhipicephalus microplus]